MARLGGPIAYERHDEVVAEAKGTKCRPIGEQLSSKYVFFRPCDGVVTVDRRPLAKVKRATEDEMDILRNALKVAATGIQKQLVMDVLAVEFADGHPGGHMARLGVIGNGRQKASAHGSLPCRGRCADGSRGSAGDARSERRCAVFVLGQSFLDTGGFGTTWRKGRAVS